MATRVLFLVCVLLMGASRGELAAAYFTSAIESTNGKSSASSRPVPVRQWVELTTQHFDPDALVKRLRQTNAIGFFTKLQLKGDIESLIKELEDHHAGKGSATLMQLEERFQLLFHKIVTLVQDSDPQLAGDLTRARQSLWEWVSDPRRAVKS